MEAGPGLGDCSVGEADGVATDVEGHGSLGDESDGQGRHHFLLREGGDSDGESCLEEGGCLGGEVGWKPAEVVGHPGDGNPAPSGIGKTCAILTLILILILI